MNAVVNDFRTGHPYRVKVVGRPDLRRVRRYYYGIMNNSQSTPASGYFYLNDVVLDGVKRDMGMANRAWHYAGRHHASDVRDVGQQVGADGIGNLAEVRRDRPGHCIGEPE